VICKITEGEKDIVYKIYHFPSTQTSDQYRNLQNLLEKYSSSRSGNTHALVPTSELSFIAHVQVNPSEERVIPASVQNTILESPVEFLSEDQMREEFVFTRHTREGSFRDFVLYFYEYKCAATGTYIKYKDLYNLEAAHIIPNSHRGPSHPKNGIALSRDMHWAFDKGFLTINDDYKIVVHSLVRSVSVLSPLAGKSLFLPSDKRAWPSDVALSYHRKHVFGIFEQSVDQ